MKLFMLFIVSAVLVSCGKPSQDASVQRLRSGVLASDSDGDGVSDFDELQRGTDPYVADLSEELPAAPEEIMLATSKRETLHLAPRTHRVLRRTLLKAAFTPSRVGQLPAVPQLELDFRHLPSFWRVVVAGEQFTDIAVPGASKRDALALGLEQTALRLNAQVRGDLASVEARTYRLIVSTPEGEKTYRVSVSVPLRDFLRMRSLFPKGKGLNDLREEGFGWRFVGFTDTYDPEVVAGKTFAIVYGEARQFRAARSDGVYLSTTLNDPAAVTGTESMHLTVIVPPVKELNLRTSERVVSISTAHDGLVCRERVANVAGVRAWVPQSIAEAREVIDVNALGRSNVEWIESGKLGSVVRIRLLAPITEVNLQVNRAFYDATVTTGVVGGSCRAGRNARVKHLPRFSLTQLHAYLDSRL